MEAPLPGTEHRTSPGGCAGCVPAQQHPAEHDLFSQARLNEPIYHDQFYYLLEFDHFDAEVLQGAVRELMDKHAILRTTVRLETFSEPVQLVHRAPFLDLVVEDLTASSIARQEQAIKDYMRRDLDDKFRFDGDCSGACAPSDWPTGRCAWC